MRRNAIVPVALLLTLLAFAGCDLTRPGGHGARGGLEECEAFSHHSLEEPSYFTSLTWDYPDTSCIRVAAQLVYRNYSGELIATGWLFDRTHADVTRDAVSSPKSRHQVCLTDTRCPGGEQ